jgi:nucleoside phosphorylase
MKILLIEDSHVKIERVLSRIVGVGGLSRDDIDVSFNVFDARKLLGESQYDLLILDLFIPLRAGEQPNPKNSENLLTELRDRASMKKPRHIIGFTAFDEGASALQPIFSQQTWTIIRYAENTGEWGDQLVRAIEWISRSSEHVEAAQYKTDLCIVTALNAPEYEAVMRNGWEWEAAAPLDDTTFANYASFQSDGHSFRAVAAHSPKMGMVDAALLCAKIIHLVRPKFLVMAGICGGVKGKANYGDPVIADPCWDWQSGKHILKDGNQAFEVSPEQMPLAMDIRSRWEQFRGEKGFWTNLKAGWPSAPDTDVRPRLGPSVSGAAVLADATIIEKIKAQHRGLIALEMEAYAVLKAAAAAARPRPIAFSCKSVCDFADETKDDKWQAYAAYTSAAAVTEFFERYMHQLDPKA